MIRYASASDHRVAAGARAVPSRFSRLGRQGSAATRWAETTMPTADKSDWRLQGQEKYLRGVTLAHKRMTCYRATDVYTIG